MKKYLLVLPLAVAAVFVMGCSPTPSSTVSMGVSSVSDAADVNVASLAEELNSQVEFGEDLTKLDDAGLERVYRIESSDFTEAAGYTGSGATVDQISVWEAPDAAAAQKIEDALKDFLETQIESYSTYMPDEVPKLEDAVLKRSGVYVALCVSEDAAKASEIISAAF